MQSPSKVGLLYVACTRSNMDPKQNILCGTIAIAAVLIGPLSLILFPNCTFIRPHPACWRMVFGASLCYFFALIFILVLNMDQVRNLMFYIDPSLRDSKREIDTVESYAENCNNVSLSTIYDALDIFAFAHFWGWLRIGLNCILYCFYKPFFWKCFWIFFFLKYFLIFLNNFFIS